MAGHILVISKRVDDLQFYSDMAKTQGLGLHVATESKDVKKLLTDHPQSIVFWDVDDKANVALMATTMKRIVSPVRVFAVSDDSLNQHPELFGQPVFGHHIYRRYRDPVPFLFAKMALATLEPAPFGLLRFFPSDTASQRIRIGRAAHKTAAVAAIESFLLKTKVTSRLASLVAQSADELIMNAIFDAPVNKEGVRERMKTARNKDFDLGVGENVEIEVAFTDNYVGISVADVYGSVKKEKLLEFFKKDYSDSRYTLRKTDEGAGLGLYGISQSGVSILFVCKPGVRTEVMLFFTRSDNYKDFKKGFRFISIYME